MASDIEIQLRWLLLLIGIVIVVVIYLFTKKKDRQPPPVSERKKPSGLFSPIANNEQPPAEDVADVDRQAPGLNQNQPSADENSEEIPQTAEQKIITLHIRAAPEEQFSGKDILNIAEQQALIRSGTGERGFFECTTSVDDGEVKVLFCITNMFQPGTFEWRQMDTFQTTGLSIFSQLPAVLPPLDIFRKMLACAHQFATATGGTVLDDQHQPLTDMACQEMEQSLKTYYMRQSQSKEAH